MILLKLAVLWALQYFHIPWLCPSFFPSLCSLLLGLRSNWENENIRLFGETWSYSDALVGKTYEGFFEASFQLALLTHIQLQTSWPSMKPLFLGGTLTKAYYFRSAKPGKIIITSRTVTLEHPIFFLICWVIYTQQQSSSCFFSVLN